MSPQFVLSALTRATLQSKLKVTNQRIAMLRKTFGDKSPIYKEAVEILEKGAAQKYASVAGFGPQAKQKSGAQHNIKLNMRKITKALQSPEGYKNKPGRINLRYTATGSKDRERDQETD